MDRVSKLKGIVARLRRPKGGKGLLRYVRRPERLRSDTYVEPLRDGRESYPAMLAAIPSARSHINFEMYIVRPDRIGLRFRDALVERAQNGVRVRVLLDALGSFGLADSFFEPLRAAGAEVRLFHPVAPWRPKWGLNRRDHKKILVIDDRVAFTGGINIGLEYMPIEEGGQGWIDWHAQVEGPAVADLAASFLKTWIESDGDAFAPPVVTQTSKPCSTVGVEVVANDGLRTRWRMHRAYLYAIGHAQREIAIMNAYFIPERNLRRAFRFAVKRGVKVRVIVPSNSDVPAVRYASRRLYGALLESGVRIFEWPGTMMHAKVGIIDGAWSTIGSFNLDHRSIQHNHEIGLVCVDEPLAIELQAEFERLVARCREVTPEHLASLSFWDRARDWFWFQFRALL